ncbi:hypothetical protein BH09SUM1_BH09SUM1_00930 [soil metagenome]
MIGISLCDSLQFLPSLGYRWGCLLVRLAHWIYPTATLFGLRLSTVNILRFQQRSRIEVQRHRGR